MKTHIVARLSFSSLFFIAIVFLTGAAPQQHADLILAGGKVWTADSEAPWAEAVAIQNDKIIFTGSITAARKYRSQTTSWIDTTGNTILPGFNDSHIHLLGGSLSLDRVDLIEDETLEAVQAHIRKFAAENPDRPWVLGRGWFYGSFPGGMPTKEQLDAVVPDRPAYMECYDGHSAWVNSLALKAAGITKDTKDPEDGEIVRDPATGEPTGALKESAVSLVDSKIPLPDLEDRYQLLLRAIALLNSNGITSIQDADISLTELDTFQGLLNRAAREQKITVRMKAAIRMEEDNFEAAISKARDLSANESSGLLQFGTVKGYVDGVIEAKTAAMLQPYAGSEGAGNLNWDPKKLTEAAILADKSKLQIYLHAIGDRGVRTALDAYEAIVRANGTADRRPRIEHIETISPDDYKRFKTYGVIASMQPLHADPNQNIFEVWAKNAGVERSQRAFSWGNFEKNNVRLAFGSDWPVVTSDVLRGIYCAVTRKTKKGTPEDGWHPELVVTLEQALRHYTIDGAYASFEEKTKGSITAGKLADLIVLSGDIFKTPPENILKTQVLFTVFNGKIVFTNKALL